MGIIFPEYIKEKRVIVAEDSLHMRSLLQKYLATEGYTVQVCSHGLEAEELFEEWPCDLLITDVIMPEKYGSEVARDLQKKHPSLKVILLTGATNPHTDDLKATGEFGEYILIRKPFKLDDLGKTVREIFTHISA